jgi:hypothetical protein
MNFSEHLVTACESEVPDFHSDNIVLSPEVLRCSSSLRDVIGLTCHGLAGQFAEAATQLTVSLVMSFMVKFIRECEQTLWFSVWSSNFNRPLFLLFASRVPIRMSVSENLPETACYKNHFPRRVLIWPVLKGTTGSGRGIKRKVASSRFRRNRIVKKS